MLFVFFCVFWILWSPVAKDLMFFGWGLLHPHHRPNLSMWITKNGVAHHLKYNTVLAIHQMKEVLNEQARHKSLTLVVAVAVTELCFCKSFMTVGSNSGLCLGFFGPVWLDFWLPSSGPLQQSQSNIFSINQQHGHVNTKYISQNKDNKIYFWNN